MRHIWCTFHDRLSFITLKLFGVFCKIYCLEFEHLPLPIFFNRFNQAQGSLKGGVSAHAEGMLWLKVGQPLPKSEKII